MLLLSKLRSTSNFGGIVYISLMVDFEFGSRRNFSCSFLPVSSSSSLEMLIVVIHPDFELSRWRMIIGRSIRWPRDSHDPVIIAWLLLLLISLIAGGSEGPVAGTVLRPRGTRFSRYFHDCTLLSATSAINWMVAGTIKGNAIPFSGDQQTSI